MKNLSKRMLPIAVVGLIILLATSGIWTSYATVDYTTITVTDKDRITTGSGDTISSKYLVFTKEETFENTDAFLFWKYDSSDVQGHLEKGHTYKVKVNGWRVSWLSWYRNIIEVQEEIQQ